MSNLITILEYRLNNNYSQRYMADMLELPLNTYAYQEKRNSFSGDTFELFSKKFRVSKENLSMRKVKGTDK